MDISARARRARRSRARQRLGWGDKPIEADIAMDCIEYMLTAP
jgi:hypothetical protein